MDKEYIIRRVKAKMNFMKKIKELKNKIIKKTYKTLNEENAIAYTKDLGKTHYWGFDVKDKPKVSKRTYRGVPVIDVEIENSRDKFGDAITVWLDPTIGKLHGDYKIVYTQHAKHKPKFQFTPLTEESAIAYVKTVSEVKYDKSRKVKKVTDHEIDMLDVPVESKEGYDLYFTVWYDPGYMGLYGEW